MVYQKNIVQMLPYFKFLKYIFFIYTDQVLK